MKRRKFLKLIIFFFISITSVFFFKKTKKNNEYNKYNYKLHVTKKRRILKLIHSWGNFDSNYKYTLYFKNSIESINDSNIIIDIIKEERKLLLDKVSTGEYDMYHAQDTFWGHDYDPTFYLYFGMPCGYNAQESFAWVNQGHGHIQWTKTSYKYNIIPIILGSYDHQMFGWFKKEIHSLEDMKNISIRYSGISAKIMKSLGVNVQEISLHEAIKQAKNEGIDGIEYADPACDIQFKLHEVFKYYYGPSPIECGDLLSLGININTWNSLSRKEQDTISSVANDITQRSFIENELENRMAIESIDISRIKKVPKDVIESIRKEVKTFINIQKMHSQTFSTIYHDRQKFHSYRTWEKIKRQYEPMTE